MGTHPYFTDKCKISMACMWKTIWWFLKKVNIKLLYYPTIPLLSILPEELKTSIQTNTCTGIFIVALFSITEMWKLPICPLTDEWIHKMWYIYTFSEILFNHKKGQHSDTCYTVDEPWKHYAKWNKPDTEEQYDMISFIRNTQNRQIHRDRK